MQIRRGKMKTRVMAFGLAMLMGIAPIGNIPAAYAKEGKEQTKSVKQEKKNTQADEVTAEDITKDISDSSFTAETCLEGILYDPEKETVVCISIEDEKGDTYQEDQPGIYAASYLVVPKDEDDSYTITRNIILTDTEGEVFDDDNGGESNREDTDTEDEDLEEPEAESPEEMISPEVVITSLTGEDEDLEALEEQLENGEVLFFSAAVSSAQTTASLVKGDKISYPSYIGNYSTCWFWVNGKIAYCLESNLASPATGDYVASVLESNKKLQKVLYYGYGGAGDVTSSYLSGKSASERYVYTHIAASYAYVGDKGFTGCNYQDLVSAGVIAYIDYLFGLEEPPEGELSLSKTSVEATRSGNTQKTSDIILKGDYRNYITVSAPSGVTIHNKTKSTSSTGGSLKIYGGDTFYMSAGLTVTGSYSSGSLYGSVSETWQTLVLSTGNSSQDIGVFISEKAAPVSFSVKWLDLVRIELEKKDSDTKNPLMGAVYGIYTDKACTKLLLTMDATGADGKVNSDYFDANLKTVYVREITAPSNYVYNSEVYTVTLKAGTTVAVTATDNRVRGAIKINKVDVETQSFLSQADSELAGAVYGLYAREDIVHPDGKTGVLYKKDRLITQGTIKVDGTLSFSNLYLGKVYVKEITAPKGYTVDTTEYDVELSSEGQETAVVTRNLTVKETVIKQAFQLIKVSEDGSQTEVNLVEGAGFTVYLVSNLSKVKSGELKPANGSTFTAADFIGYDFAKEKSAVTYQNGVAVPVEELITDSKGYAISPELPYGLYVVAETSVPENLHPVNPFLVDVNEDSREPMQWRIFDDRPYQFLLKVIKKDEQTGNTVLKSGATYKIYDCEQEAFVEQVVYYPKKEVVDTFMTNDEGYLILPEKLKSSTYRIIEIAAPDGFVRQGYEMSLYNGSSLLSALDITAEGIYKDNGRDAIEVSISSNTAYQVDPDTGVAIVEVVQPNDEQVGSLTLYKTGEQLTGISETSLWEQIKAVFELVKAVFTGEETDTGVYNEFAYEEAGVEGAVFELYAKETIYSPDNAVDVDGDPVVRYEKDSLVATLITDENGEAVVNNLPLGTYYLKETVAGEHFVLNTEQKEFILTAEDDTQAVVYEGVAYKNERQTIEISVEKKDVVSGETLEGVVFGLYSAEDILSLQGEILIEKDTLLEKKATDAEGKLTFDSDLFHGCYYVKEEQSLPGYLNNEDIWEIQTSYEDQNEDVLYFTKEIENQPTESHFTKVDLTTEEELEGATLQIIDSEDKIVEEWVSTTEAHVVYGLPEGTYTLREELAPNANGYVSAEDITFEVFEDGSITEVTMKDGYSLLDVLKTDLETGDLLEGAVLQILNEAGDILAEWTSSEEPYRIDKLPVGETLILHEVSAPEGYELAEDIVFVLEDTMEVQQIEMKDAKIVEKGEAGAPKTGDTSGKTALLFILCGISASVVALKLIRKKKYCKPAEK